ncbi:MAG: hypothetical protein ACWGN2_01295 [Anaerolineales bacterium]
MAAIFWRGLSIFILSRTFGAGIGLLTMDVGVGGSWVAVGGKGVDVETWVEDVSDP